MISYQYIDKTVVVFLSFLFFFSFKKELNIESMLDYIASVHEFLDE